MVALKKPLLLAEALNLFYRNHDWYQFTLAVDQVSLRSITVYSAVVKAL